MSKLLALQFNTITTPGGYQPGSGIEGSTSAIEKLISNTLVILTIVSGLAFTLYFLLGGLNWIVAGGDKGKIDKAKSMMTNGAIGMVVIAVSYAITWIVGKALGIDILNPGTLINGLKVN
jgi:cytochrome bd-type quinol oxidase subunit 2